MNTFLQGLSMSGADSKEARQDIENSLKVRSEVVSQSYFVCCDTVGAVSTASEKGNYQFFIHGHACRMLVMLRHAFTRTKRDKNRMCLLRSVSLQNER